jgi:hypothetical protein
MAIDTCSHVVKVQLHPLRALPVIAWLGPLVTYLSAPSTFDIHAEDSSSAVFIDPVSEPAGLYSCPWLTPKGAMGMRQRLTSGHGGRAELLGPYPSSGAHRRAAERDRQLLRRVR